MITYSEEFTTSLADEMEALPPEFTTTPMAIMDYAKLRDRIRACEQEKDTLDG